MWPIATVIMETRLGQVFTGSRKPFASCTNCWKTPSRFLLRLLRNLNHLSDIGTMEKYRFRIAYILKTIESVREALKDLAISIDRHSESPWHDCEDRWHLLGDDLLESLEDAARFEPELREVLYQRAIAGLPPTERQREETSRRAVQLLESTEDDEAAPEQIIPAKVRMALEFIKAKGPVKAVLVANHIDISHPGFRTRYVPKLKALGVKNDGDGYYYPKPAAPDSDLDQQGPSAPPLPS
jgi:hypothetical protein